MQFSKRETIMRTSIYLEPSKVQNRKGIIHLKSKNCQTASQNHARGRPSWEAGGQPPAHGKKSPKWVVPSPVARRGRGWAGKSSSRNGGRRSFMHHRAGVQTWLTNMPATLGILGRHLQSKKWIMQFELIWDLCASCPLMEGALIFGGS